MSGMASTAYRWFCNKLFLGRPDGPPLNWPTAAIGFNLPVCENSPVLSPFGHWVLVFIFGIHLFITLTTGCCANVWVFSVLNSRVKQPISEFVPKEASATATRAPVLVQGAAILLHTKAGDHRAILRPLGHSDRTQ